MKTIKFFAATLALTAIFASCTKDNSANSNGEPKTVFVKIVTKAMSRAVDKGSVTDGTKTPLNDAVVYFLDGNDKIVSVAGTMDATELGTGKQFTGISPAAVKAYVVANLINTYTSNPLFPSISALMFHHYKSDIEAFTASAGTQMGSSAMGVENVVLSGEVVLTPVSGSDYNAAVTVTPTVCRFEVTSITGSDQISDYDLEGIYLNTYYPLFTVGGGSAGTYYSLSLSANDLAMVDPFMKDDGLSLTGLLNYKPAANKVWAYMVPVGNTTPRVILKLTNVKIGGIPEDAPRYITVKNFKDSNTGLIITLKRGEVYVIKDIKFTQADITPLPNQDDINITVTVDVKAWKTVSVDPII